MHDVRVAVGGENSPRPGAGFARCGHCGHDYDDGAWRSLEVVGRITTDEVRALVTVWPGSASIEVRRCEGCRQPIARKRG